MFLNTLSISLYAHLYKRDENGIAGEDIRKGGNKKLSEEVKEEVKCHIGRFPTMKGQVRERLTRKYLHQTSTCKQRTTYTSKETNILK